MFKSLYLLILITHINGDIFLPIQPVSNTFNTEIFYSTKKDKSQEDFKGKLQQFLTDLFTKDGRESTDVEFVDDESEKMLNKYGFFFNLFFCIFILMAINSLFFYDKK